jgi:hypothetical protein
MHALQPRSYFPSEHGGDLDRRGIPDEFWKAGFVGLSEAAETIAGSLGRSCERSR